MKHFTAEVQYSIPKEACFDYELLPSQHMYIHVRFVLAKLQPYHEIHSLVWNEKLV